MEFFNAYLSTDESLNPLGSSSPGCSLGLPFQDRLRERANSAGASSASTSPPKKNVGGKRVRHLSCQQQSEILFQEVQAFLLAPHLLWCMWSIIQSTNTKIPFGYWVSKPDHPLIFFSHACVTKGLLHNRNASFHIVAKFYRFHFLPQSYASDRMEDYISHKNAILAMTDPILGIGQKRTLHENWDHFACEGGWYFKVWAREGRNGDSLGIFILINADSSHAFLCDQVNAPSSIVSLAIFLLFLYLSE